jgi:Tol biopolymer transport system component
MRPLQDPPDERLDSWKDIATYLKRDVSTVQRWEKREGLPVHRHLHDRLGSVYAFRTELDAWWQSRNVRAGRVGSPVVGSSTDVSATGAGDLRTEKLPLEHADVIAVESTSSPRAAASRPPARRGHLRWLALAAGAVFAVGTAVWLLVRADYFWQNPLTGARFQQLTDFEGTEHAAAISRDGRFVAFLADRDGSVDAWMTQVGTGQFHNLTMGRVRELINPDVRTMGFSPDATLVLLWVRKPNASKSAEIGVWAVPTLGGEPRPYLEGVAEFDWSRDGARLVYHTPGPGDPLFVKDDPGRTERQIFAANSGLHGHFPVWSPDERFIYFAHGALPDEMDIWRIRPTGGAPERVTFHNSRVTHPTFLNRRTLLYLATDNRSGPWLYALDVERRRTRRISFGVERYTSLAGSADGRRLVATIANPKGTLWRVPIADHSAGEADATRVALRTNRGRAPRLGADYLLYVSSSTDGEVIWKLAGGTATELWSAPRARVIGGPAIAPDGRRVAFSAEERGRRRLYLMNSDGSAVRALPESLEPYGTPVWAPDGQSIAVAAIFDGTPRVARVSLDGQRVVPLVSGYSVDPAWLPDGASLVYSGPDVGTTFQVMTVSVDGRPWPEPNLTLSRGARRVCFLPGRRALVVLRGEINHKNFWLMDLETGTERQLTRFGRDFIIRDFDISADGREIVFDREQESSDLVLIDLARR